MPHGSSTHASGAPVLAGPPPCPCHAMRAPLLDEVVQPVRGRQGRQLARQLGVVLGPRPAHLLGVRLDVPADGQTDREGGSRCGCGRRPGTRAHKRTPAAVAPRNPLRAAAAAGSPEGVEQRLVGEPVDVLDVVVGLAGAMRLFLRLTRVYPLEDAQPPGGNGQWHARRKEYKRATEVGQDPPAPATRAEQSGRL